MATDKVGSGDTALNNMYAQMKQMGATGAGFAGVIMDAEKKTDPNAVIGKQSLIVEKDGVFYALGGKKPLKLESKDPETAKEEARTKIKEGSLSDLAGLSFDNITKKKMAGAQEGGGETTASPDVKPVAGVPNDAVEALVKEYPQGGAAPLPIKDKNGKPSTIIIGTKDGGKTYEARDLNGKTIPLKTPKDVKNILAENKDELTKAINNDFGLADQVVSGPVNQPNVNTASGTEAGAPNSSVNTVAPNTGTPAAPEGGAQPTTVPTEGGQPTVVPTVAPTPVQPAPVGA